MGMGLYFRPVTPKNEERVDVTACQVRQDLNALFGDYPITLTKAQLPELKTLQQLWLGKNRDSLMDNDPYGEIIKLVNKSVDGIELFEAC